MINYLPWWSVKYLSRAVGWAELLSESALKAPPTPAQPSEGCVLKFKCMLPIGKRLHAAAGKGLGTCAVARGQVLKMKAVLDSLQLKQTVAISAEKESLLEAALVPAKEQRTFPSLQQVMDKTGAPQESIL